MREQSFIHEPFTNISNISSRFSSNSEADASELLENIEEMFLRYNIQSRTVVLTNRKKDQLSLHDYLLDFS